MLHTEIVTAVQEGLKLTIVLVDNHGYGCIHGLQRGCGGNSFGNEFRLRTPQVSAARRRSDAGGFREECREPRRHRHTRQQRR